jgi:hypothetical protein
MATLANISHLDGAVLAVVALAALGVMGAACVVLRYLGKRKTAVKPPRVPNDLKRPVASANTSAKVPHGKKQT